MPPRPLAAGPDSPERAGAGRRALRLALLAGTVALALGACGRRGQPEPPRDPSVPAAGKQTSSAAKPARGSRRTDTARTEPETTSTDVTNRPLAATQNTSEDEEEEPDSGVAVSPQPTPTGRKRVRAYQVPKEPFFLDPLL